MFENLLGLYGLFLVCALVSPSGPLFPWKKKRKEQMLCWTACHLTPRRCCGRKDENHRWFCTCYFNALWTLAVAVGREASTSIQLPCPCLIPDLLSLYVCNRLLKCLVKLHGKALHLPLRYNVNLLLTGNLFFQVGSKSELRLLWHKQMGLRATIKDGFPKDEEDGEEGLHVWRDRLVSSCSFLCFWLLKWTLIHQ